MLNNYNLKMLAKLGVFKEADMSMQDIKVGEVVRAYGKVVAIIETANGYEYKVQFGDDGWNVPKLPRYKIVKRERTVSDEEGYSRVENGLPADD